MIVHVRLFARARQLAGAEVLPLELPDGATIADLRRRLAADCPALASLLARSALAVEDEFAADGLVLTPQQEVALLPPVSGGEAEGPFQSPPTPRCRAGFLLPIAWRSGYY